ncbi:TPA: helix-turn-helix domain-containing protein [Escherichia coli]|nr:helix-turn-helix domain-containing protein [Escherichia coli]HCO4199166.1 helix-turn-helix domain-containing protein [Escherichia coli]HCO4208699.1 helix-turn-helix domain-containing protein [Escherichia coli]HCO4213284.1 helix-turn-helix domain-containing protein [Escherichia coli]HCO4217867.1 helix-turn-helix domain-containing protein [Escherichia coli]
MSTKLTGYVWDGCAASGMKLSSVAIMARLADFSNDEGVCWPSIETIARQIGAGMSTVRTAIARLEAEGWLTRRARRQGNRNASNVYQLNVAKLQAAAFSQLSDSDPSKSDASKSDPSKFDASKSGKKAGFHPSESGGDPSVKSKHDPSDKKTSRPDASQPDTQTAEQDFLTRHPDAVVFSPKKRQWGTQDDLTCAQWLWKKIIALYEHAAECDGEVVRPKEPNWTAWANEIRLMCVQDGRTHKQICEMYSRVSRDPFWCRNVLSPSKLREKWDELSLRLSPSVSTYTEKREERGFPPTNQEVATMLGYRSVNAAVEHLRALEKKGVITIKRGVARGITLHTAVKDDDSEVAGIIRALLAGEENARLRAAHWLHERGLKV